MVQQPVPAVNARILPKTANRPRPLLIIALLIIALLIIKGARDVKNNQGHLRTSVLYLLPSPHVPAKSCFGIHWAMPKSITPRMNGLFLWFANWSNDCSLDKKWYTAHRFENPIGRRYCPPRQGQIDKGKLQMQQSKIKILLASLFISVVLSSGANKAAGQNTAHLPPQKTAVVKQLKEEAAKRQFYLGCITGNLAVNERQRLVEEMLDNLDPILVGKHVVFSKKWRNYIGPNKSITAQQFESLRDRTDRVYDAYKELIGRAPKAGEKVYIEIRPAEYFRKPNGGHVAGHAHSNAFCINENFVRNSMGTLMHELAHVFAYATNWEVKAESIVPLLMAYAYETIPGETLGNRHRISRFEAALNNFRTNKIEAFALDDPDDSGYGAHAFDFYLLGLVDKVGWETYKKVFRTYADEPHVTIARFPGGQAGKARDLFDRIERLSGKPGVLRSLPDKGELLDKYFSVQVQKAPPYDSPYEDLLEAAEMGTARDVESFVNKGGDVNAKNAVGFTALHYAAQSNAEYAFPGTDAFNRSVDVMRYLISAGANVNAKTNIGRTPLHQAAMSNALQMWRS